MTNHVQLVRELGGPNAAFKPAMENLVAGIIIGLLMILGGGAIVAFGVREAILNGANLPWFAREGSCFAAVLGMSILGLAIAVGGVGLIIWVRGLFSLRVFVCEQGFFCVKRKRVQVFRWDQIAVVREIIIKEHFPLKGAAKHVAPMGTSRSFVVRRQDGVEFAFDGNTVKKLNSLAKLIEQATRQRGILWDVQHG